MVVAGANVPDSKLLGATLDAIVGSCPSLDDRPVLLADRAYRTRTAFAAGWSRGYEPHLRRQGEGGRWVVERTLAWVSKCRGLLVRWEKKAQNYLGLLQIACALLWYRRLWRAGLLR